MGAVCGFGEVVVGGMISPRSLKVVSFERRILGHLLPFLADHWSIP
jgi:hypothetical protein